MRRGGRGVAAAVLAAALAAGCTSEDDPPAPADTTGAEVVTDHELDNPEFTPGDEASPEPIPAEDGAVRALSTAADELGGLAFELERTEDGGAVVWEVELRTTDGASTEVRVDAVTGEVL